MTSNNGISFYEIQEEFCNLVKNQDYEGLHTFLSNISNDILNYLKRRQLNRTFDPVRILCGMEDSEQCLELILNYAFRITRRFFLNKLLRHDYGYLQLLINNNAPIDRTALIIVGHNEDVNLLNMFFERWGETGTDMDIISFNFLKYNKFQSFNWCMQKAEFYVNVERCLVYATQNSLFNFLAILQEN